MCGFARWAKNCEGWSKEKIEKHIRSEFFKNGLNVVLLRETIHKAVLGSRFDFLERETVIITREEIEKISKIKNRKWEKSVFSILVYSKKYGIYSGKNIYIWQSLKEILGRYNIFMGKKEYDEFIGYINEKNYIVSVVRKRKLSWRIQIYTEGDFFCEIMNFSNFQNLLPFFCLECGVITEGRNKYCKSHNNGWQREKRKRATLRV
jgi:hypothetical protein